MSNRTSGSTSGPANDRNLLKISLFHSSGKDFFHFILIVLLVLIEFSLLSTAKAIDPSISSGSAQPLSDPLKAAATTPESANLSTKTIIIIIASSVGGLLVLTLIIGVTCACGKSSNPEKGSLKDHGKAGSLYVQGDRKLAQSAQMYHYQHQKQQMIAMENANLEQKQAISEDESEADNEDGDTTIYECPGLAPTGELEVVNPMFKGDMPNNESESPVDGTSKNSKKRP